MRPLRSDPRLSLPKERDLHRLTLLNRWHLENLSLYRPNLLGSLKNQLHRLTGPVQECIADRQDLFPLPGGVTL